MNLLHEAQAELGRSNMSFARAVATVSIAESMASIAESMTSIAASLKILAGPQVGPAQHTEMQKIFARLAENVAANDPDTQEKG